MQTLNQDIKNNDFKKVYLLFGEEAFLKKSYKNRLREAITQGDTMNYNYYEGKGINVNEIISLSDTMPLNQPLSSIRIRRLSAKKGIVSERLMISFTFIPFPS